VAMGGLLGGGSSINLMMYTRAQGIDYDSWKMPGWTAKDMIPLCKKLETFHQDEDDIDRSKHGYDGPIHVSDGGFTAMSTKVHLETVKKIGYSEVVDLQDFEQIGGFTVSIHAMTLSMNHYELILRFLEVPAICFARWE
jgi:alcohol oxidase